MESLQLEAIAFYIPTVYMIWWSAVLIVWFLRLRSDMKALDRWCMHIECGIRDGLERIDDYLVVVRALRILAASAPETDPHGAWRDCAREALNKFSEIADPPLGVFQVPQGQEESDMVMPPNSVVEDVVSVKEES